MVPSSGIWPGKVGGVLWPMVAEEEEKRAGVKSTYRLGAARQNWCWKGSTGLKSLTGCGAGGKIKGRCYMWVQWQRRTHLRQGQDHLQEVPHEHWLALMVSIGNWLQSKQIWVGVEDGSLTLIGAWSTWRRGCGMCDQRKSTWGCWRVSVWGESHLLLFVCMLVLFLISFGVYLFLDRMLVDLCPQTFWHLS